ncbi:flagellar hook-length control protein FliK [Noviherbaspirillum denitrificans]|uniref:Flagellar hook-length control protein-like C-terminal domain-containing protein n=1 Tax=Noviherbaspirillum denitrificans TaxID=1968433 RepID=A0A254T9G9_9BURK|nr:flagellar hook-length control protein FliK [Noviherbaspirillum denitrificans]OWW18807.1 hypothetical protein AYR66_04430 [Noviherbaspirillum denitrificans]
MQTSQVTNTANLIAPAPAKQADSSPAPEPFGKVLSREVSQRNGSSDAPKNKEATGPAQAREPAKAPAKAQDAQSAKDSKRADKAAPEDEAADSTPALPSDMLALVANINELQTPAAPAAEAQTAIPSEPAPDAQAVVAAAVVPTAVPQTDLKPAEAATPSSASPQSTLQTDAPVITAGLQPKSEGAAAQLRTAEKLSAKDVPAATVRNAKVEDLNAQPVQQQAETKGRDFATAMNDSLNTVSATVQLPPQAALQAVQHQAANATEKLTPRVGTPAWDQALGQKVVWMVAGEQQSASLTLNPPDLGPLQVVLNVSNSQANATFIAAQPEVRQALEAALPKLRDMLGEAGIQLGQANVSSGAPNQQGSFDQQAAQAARNHGPFDGRENGRGEGQVQISRVQPASSGTGLVDTFV